jgi:hypothetical protein
MLKFIYKKLLALSLLTAGLFIYSCSDIIEKDISNEKVLLVAPGNGLETTITSHQFIWEPIEGAIEYNVQIASPDFGLIERMLLDSIVSANKIGFNLNPGAYEWRVKAINGSSNTVYSTYILHIDSTADLSGMPLVLVSPQEGAVTGQTQVEFHWDPIAIADGYRLEITNAGGLNEIVYDQNHSEYIVNIEVPEGNLNWRVHAYNATPSVSNWSESRSISVDLTPPSTPILQYPTVVNNPLPLAPITFEFQSGIDALTTTYDSLWISQSILFLAPIRQVKINDGEVYSDSLGVGSYFWRVKTIDAAGNGTMSSVANFIIQ